MSLTYRSQTIDKLWTVLATMAQASQFPALKQIKDNPQGVIKKIVLRSPADLPHMEIDLGPNFGGTVFAVRSSRAQSFSAERPGYAGTDTEESATADITITISYDKSRHDYAFRDGVEMSIIEAIRKAGVGLDLSFCSGIGPYRAVKGTTQITGEIKSFIAVTTIITLPFLYELKGVDVIPS